MKDALRLLSDARRLRGQLDEFITTIEQSATATLREKLDTRVDSLNLPKRVNDVFDNAGIEYVGQVVRCYQGELLRQSNFGRTALNEVKRTLDGLGLKLGMKKDDLCGWERPQP